MGKSKPNTCPGCSRHCSLDHVRCKYGEKYLEKMQKAQVCGYKKQEASAEAHRYKWEKHVTKGSLSWKLLWIGSRLKRALRKKTITEEQILRALSADEQAQLEALLTKLTQYIP